MRNTLGAGDSINPEYIPRQIKSYNAPGLPAVKAAGNLEFLQAEHEREVIADTLKTYEGNKTKTAESLYIHISAPCRAPFRSVPLCDRAALMYRHEKHLKARRRLATSPKSSIMTHEAGYFPFVTTDLGVTDFGFESLFPTAVQ